jgi:O-acetyl-ADP-ribose deacetylase (regulator of RNase III)
MAKRGDFNVIAHGCNCFCVMGAGIAPKMVEAFDCDELPLEDSWFSGDINKLGNIEYARRKISSGVVNVVNCYTQYETGGLSPLNYEALTLCMKKINHIFKGKHIGLPKIGCGLAGGDWNRVKRIIQSELKDCDVTIVIYE